MRQFRMRVAMWCLAVVVPLAAITVMAIPLVGFAAPGGAPFTATPTEPTAGDLAKALKVDWWCYHLQFNRQIKGIRVILCEARRQRDGAWTQEDLTESFFDHTQQFREIDIAFFIPDPPRPTKFALRVGRSFQWGKFKKPPDIEGIVARPTDAHLVDDCLLLGFYPEKDPQSVTGRKENMLRYIGLRIETAE
jgi:hypothetical protein